MLSVKRCREILRSDLAIPDDRLLRLREELYSLAEVVTAGIAAGGPTGPTATNGDGTFRGAMTFLSEDEKSQVEERAAIMEFDGGLSRDEAERRALARAIRHRREHG